MITVIITIGIFILIVATLIINWRLNEKAPEERVEAILIKKSMYIDTNINDYNTNTTYTLKFDVNGKIKKFRVRHSAYKKHNENQKGTLVFKRRRFVDFIV